MSMEFETTNTDILQMWNQIHKGTVYQNQTSAVSTDGQFESCSGNVSSYKTVSVNRLSRLS